MFEEQKQQLEEDVQPVVPVVVVETLEENVLPVVPVVVVSVVPVVVDP